MADGTPQFGGTNGVAVMDVGQPGVTGGRHESSEVQFRCKVLPQPPRVAEVQHAAAQSNVLFTDRVGWRGEMVTWSGSIVIKDATELADLRSVLNQYLTGSAISGTTGVRGAPDQTFLRPTIMKDSFGKALGSAVIMTGYRFGRQFATLASPAGFTYGNHLQITFKILG